MIFTAATITLQEAWGYVDLMMGLMTVFNLIAVLMLSKYVWRLLNDYKQQKKEGKEPTFHRSTLDDIKSDLDCWE